jgi:hypothetical protein
VDASSSDCCGDDTDLGCGAGAAGANEVAVLVAQLAGEHPTSRISTTHRCWGGHPGPEIRAAQVLSLACRNADYAPRIFAAFSVACSAS